MRLKRWAGFACAIFFIAIALTSALWAPFIFPDRHNKYKIPSKIVIADKRVFLSLGYPATAATTVMAGGRMMVMGEKGSKGKKGESGGDLVSFVEIESEASVKDVTIQVVKVDFTERRDKDEDAVLKMVKKMEVKETHKGGKGGKHDDDDDDEDDDDLDEPALMYGTTKTNTGTLVQFRVGRSKSRIIEEARLRLKVTVPIGFDGELTIDGTQLHIESSPTLAQARFNLLHLTTNTGNINLTGSDTDSIGTHSYARKKREESIALRVSTLTARINHEGSITVGPVRSAVPGRAFRTSLETQRGDVSLVAVTTMITPGSDDPWEYPEPEDVVYYFNPVSHSHGDIHLDIRAGELEEGDDDSNGYLIGMVVVTAQAEGGSVRGRVVLNDYQLATINADSHSDTVLEVSDIFVGELAVTSSKESKATVVPNDTSETVITYRHSDRSVKLGSKLFPNDEFSRGNIGLHSTHGSSTLIFS
ncbi:hypothetical protein BGX23_000537 [Mortierella sp. AD031]|nr:hypothetical protein BGX23_000537 [Mortierella sp. AD031]